MSKKLISTINSHPDKEELISKLALDYKENEIHDWLASKYNSPSEKQFVLSANQIKTFKDSYMDIYQMIQDDVSKNKKALKIDPSAELQLGLQNNLEYKNKINELAGKEIDLKRMISNLILAVETRLGQIFDKIQADYAQNPENMSTKLDYVLISYVESLSNSLEKLHKFTEVPEITQNNYVQNNISLQFLDENLNVFQEAIRETLSEMDIETSLIFMEKLNLKLSKLRAPREEVPMTVDMKLSEAKALNSEINRKLNN